MNKGQETVLKEALELYEDDVSYWNEMYQRVDEDMRFYFGDDRNKFQWDEDARKQRQNDDRPILTFNRVAAAVDQVINDQKMNRMEIRVRPDTNGADKEVAEIYEGLIRAISRDSDGESAFDTAFEWQVPAGFGALRLVNCFADDESFEQILKFKRIPNPHNVVPDAGAKEENFKDMMHCFLTETHTKKAFQKKWPKARATDFKGNSSGGSSDWFSKDSVRVGEYFERNEIKKHMGLFDDGSVHRLCENGRSKKKIEEAVREIQEKHKCQFVRDRSAVGYEVKHWIMSGAEILSEEMWPGTLIPIIICTGKEVIAQGQRYYKGIIRNARDPQKVYNYSRTSDIEVVALQPKSPFVATPAQVAGHEAQWKNANKKNISVLLYNPDPKAATARPERESPPLASSGLGQQSALAVDDIKATTTLFDASLGASSNETSGKAIIARERQGDVGTYHFQDNLKKAMEYAGEVLIDAIPHVYDTERVIEIMSEDGKEKEVQINQIGRDEDGYASKKINNLKAGRYKITIDTGPSYTTRRVQAADSIQAIIQAVPEAAEILGDKLVQNMDWPGSDEIATRLKKVLALTRPELLTPEEMEEVDIQPQQNKGPSPEQVEQQLEMQKQQIELQQAEIKKQIEEIKLLIEQAKLQGFGPPQQIQPF